MSYTREFVSLNKALHDRDSFDCGEPELNIFIRSQATRLMDTGISKTMTLPASVSLPNGKKQIYAFYTISSTLIKREDLPKNLAKKLLPYPIPVFLLAQLAVHKEFQGYGLGKITLVNSLQYFHKINTYMPAFAVIVDCLNENSEKFYLKYGFKKLCQINGRARLYISMTELDILFN